MRTGGMLDAREFGKRIRRLIDVNYSYRKLLLFILICGGVLLYFGPQFAQWLFSTAREPIEAFEHHCMTERLATFYFDAAEYNVNILHDPPLEKEHQYLPYIGNGVFGIPVSPEGWMYIKHGRALLLPIQWQPLVSHPLYENSFYSEATVTHFTTGIVHKYQCLREGYYLSFQYYAHRVLDAILVQDVKIVNPTSLSQEIPLKPLTAAHWANSRLETIKIQVDGFSHEYNLISGFISLSDSNKVIVISIVYKDPPKIIQIKARSTIKLEFLTSIQYSEPVSSERYHIERDVTKRKAIDILKKAIVQQQKGLKEEHVKMWQSYWSTGFRISDSKAAGAINGHKINSTMYLVLSQIPRGLVDVEKKITTNEGCYHGHHTLDAPKLWKDTSSIDSVNEIVDAWLLTLEKRSCHHLMIGGPPAVQQAIVLSLGGLRFTNQHLEFNIDPQYLHRDYLFRRISYGNVTHVNISVTVGEDNRAILGVALDKSDSVYFGCDAGCLDAPVSLSQTYTNFPVKLTKPLTAILYITSDYQHMQDLRNALHVHAVDDAPAHDHHVMALHKHGHQLGGLPTLFWISICFLIIVFHLFLCKLILNEYYGHQDRQKVRYNKA
ncbi:hypothetical protein HZH66_013191 [Vespula vulgaris]|uniref:Uncharacterized protein n=1 Tax=Vespula vulgaris TaxID=7454 RepID=A0A834MT64_VESVU|nr:uncharacterized protein KIAA2013 homolog isoform X1 [Vespula vulgaris]XP_050865195.1 uncharacterized protein KIAA2013 homolog isoform X1 [Vespula vulgaris]KAF7382789.1 hypothetical protein HZH66_013191 [Vespula vulgaris]